MKILLSILPCSSKGARKKEQGSEKESLVFKLKKNFFKKNFRKSLVVKNKSLTFANAFASKTKESSLKDFR